MSATGRFATIPVTRIIPPKSCTNGAGRPLEPVASRPIQAVEPHRNRRPQPCVEPSCAGGLRRHSWRCWHARAHPLPLGSGHPPRHPHRRLAWRLNLLPSTSFGPATTTSINGTAFTCDESMTATRLPLPGTAVTTLTAKGEFGPEDTVRLARSRDGAVGAGHGRETATTCAVWSRTPPAHSPSR